MGMGFSAATLYANRGLIPTFILRMSMSLLQKRTLALKLFDVNYLPNSCILFVIYGLGRLASLRVINISAIPDSNNLVFRCFKLTREAEQQRALSI